MMREQKVDDVRDFDDEGAPPPRVISKPKSLKDLIPKYFQNLLDDNALFWMARDKDKNNSKKYYNINDLELIKYIVRKNTFSYEILRINKPRKLYFDLEWKDNEFENNEQTLTNFLNFVKEEMLKEFNVDNPDIAISGCSYDTQFGGIFGRKISYHVIFNYNKFFKNYEDSRSFTKDYLYNKVKKIKEFCYLDGKACIMDHAVYGRNQPMKMIGQSKYGKKKGTQKVINFTDEPLKHLCGIYENLDSLEYYDVSKFVNVVVENNVKGDKKTRDYSGAPVSEIHSIFPIEFTQPPGEVCNSFDYLLASIPNNDVSWDCYFGIACAVKNSPDGRYEDFRKWSMKSSKHDDPECKKMWRGIHKRYEGRRYDKRTIIKIAERCNPLLGETSAVIRNLVSISSFPNVEVVTYNEKHCRNLPDQRIVVLQANMGVGKTYQCIKKVQDNPDKSVIIFSSRILYAEGITEEYNRELLKDLGFICYHGSQKHVIENSYRLVMSPQSLFKLNEITKFFDIVIMDECESVLSELTGSTMKIPKCPDAILNSYKVFEKIMKKAENLIFCDAFISNRTINFINNIFNNRNFIMHKNTFQSVERVAEKIDNYNNFTHLMERDIKDNKKNIVYYCDSKTKIQKIKDDYPETKDYLYIYANCDPKARDTCKNVNELWKNKRLLCYNSTITVGLNYQNLDYDKMYLFGSIFCGNVRNVFQSSMRVRNLKENNLVYNLCSKLFGSAGNGISKYICYEDALQDLYLKVSRVEGTDFGGQGIEKWNDPPQWLIELTAFEMFEKSVNKYYFEDLFEYYLKINNYKKKNEINMEVSDPKEAEVKDLTFSLNFNEIVIPYGFDPDLKSTDDTFLITKAKHIFMSFIDTSEVSNINELFSKFINVNKLSLTQSFWNIIKEAKSTPEMQHLKDIKENRYAMFAKESGKRLQEINTIVSKLGLESSTDNDKTVNTLTINKIKKYIKENKKDHCSLFKVRDRSNKKHNDTRKTIDQINKLLTSWSGYKLKCTSRKSKIRNNYKLELIYEKKNIDLNVFSLLKI